MAQGGVLLGLGLTRFRREARPATKSDPSSQAHQHLLLSSWSLRPKHATGRAAQSCARREVLHSVRKPPLLAPASQFPLLFTAPACQVTFSPVQDTKASSFLSAAMAIITQIQQVTAGRQLPAAMELIALQKAPFMGALSQGGRQQPRLTASGGAGVTGRGGAR